MDRMKRRAKSIHGDKVYLFRDVFPGQILTHRDGSRYEIMPNGSWRRLPEEVNKTAEKTV
jgi:hypothetical protein